MANEIEDKTAQFAKEAVEAARKRQNPVEHPEFTFPELTSQPTGKPAKSALGFSGGMDRQPVGW